MISDFTLTLDNNQHISLPSDISYLSVNINSYNINTETNYMVNNISPDLLNPFVFMVNYPDQNPGDNGFNGGNNNNNKGKGKATDEEIRGWAVEESAQDTVPMETNTLAQQTLESVLKNITPEELAQQFSIIDFYNPEPNTEINALYEYDLSRINEDLVDLNRAVTFSTQTNISTDLSKIPPALYRIMKQYPSYFGK